MNKATSIILTRLARDYILSAKFLIAIVLTLIATLSYASGIFDRIENLTLDQRFKIRDVQQVSPKIVLIEVAEDSIKSIGRWPWDREWHATIVKALKDMGASSIAFDVLFSEEADPQTDLLFANMIKSTGNVFLPVAFADIVQRTGGGLLKSMPLFTEHVKGEGHISIKPDDDGILRRIRVAITGPQKTYFQLGFSIAMKELGVDIETVRLARNQVIVPIAGEPDLVVPLTDDGDMIINWPGRWSDTYEHVSFIDTIVTYTQWLKGQKTRIPVDMFKDAIVIIGVSATGLYDIRATPLEPAYPAMGINATILNSVLQKRFVTTVSDKTNIFILWLMSALIFLIMLRTNYLQSMMMIIGIAICHTVIATIAFVYFGIVIAVIYPLFLILSSYVALTAYHQIIITIEKTRLMRLATTDSLTGMYNIGHFKRLLQAEMASMELRKKKDICLIMSDGDKFKYVNDTFGHSYGDEVLRAIADIMKTNCRALDVAARYGGEEFIVMLPGAPIEAAVKVAEKMRATIEAREFILGKDKVKHPVTASFGVTAYISGESMEDIFKRVDAGLYEAKNTGRNKVVVAKR